MGGSIVDFIWYLIYLPHRDSIVVISS